MLPKDLHNSLYYQDTLIYVMSFSEKIFRKLLYVFLIEIMTFSQ